MMSAATAACRSRLLLQPAWPIAITTTQVIRRGMAGHNKWSKIKRKKGAKDVAKATEFGKASRSIIAASRACNGDMSNLQLQSAIAHAKSIQLPKDRIQDAIDKPLSSKDGVDLETIRYDAMMSVKGSKVAVIITALSDNRKRTAANVRSTVAKYGGELLATNALNFLFEHVGVVLVEGLDGEVEQDELWDVALDAGATDIDVESDSAVVTCEASDLWRLVTALRDRGFSVDQFEHRYVLTDAELSVSVNDESQERLDAFLDRLDQDEDVTNVYHNAVLSVT